MAKTLKIDYCADRLLNVASSKLDEHDPCGALKILNTLREREGDNSETFVLYADAYDDMQLYERSINHFFLAIDCGDEADSTELYEGLAMAYMNIGKTDFSAYYYDRLLRETDGVTEVDRKALVDSFLQLEDNPLKIVYPPALADCTHIVEAGAELMRQNHMDEAISCLEEVPEGNADYVTARGYIVMAHLICDRYDVCEAECNRLLQTYPDDVGLLITKAALMGELGRREESVAIARRLLKIDVTFTADLFKIATVCCENEMHEEAYRIFCKIEEDMQYEFSYLYFKAVAANNSGKVEEAIDILDTICTIYPSAMCARYYLGILRNGLRTDTPVTMSYIYAMPTEMRENYLSMLIAYDAIPKSKCKASDADLLEVKQSVAWCLDDMDGNLDAKPLSLAAKCAIKAGLEDTVRQMLLNAFYGDELKIFMMRELALRNQNDTFGLAFNHTYHRVNLYALSIGVKKRKIFIGAYAELVARLGMLGESYCRKIMEVCEYVYTFLQEKQALDLCTDADVLAAALFTKARFSFARGKKIDVCDLFSANREKYAKLTEVLE